MWRLSVWQAQLEKAGVVAQQLSCDVCINVAEDMWPRGEKQIGGFRGLTRTPWASSYAPSSAPPHRLCGVF
jgi:hypothetical protein